MTVAFDQNGYAYDVSTGLYVNLEYDANGAAYDQATGERIDEVIVDSVGTTVYTSGGGVNWNDVIRTAAQAYAAGEGAAQSGHYIPQQPPPYPYPSGGGGGGPIIPSSPRPPGSGINLGVFGNVSPLTVAVGASVILIFLLGQMKGKR